MNGIKPYQYKVIRHILTHNGETKQVTGVYPTEEYATTSISQMRELVDHAGINVNYSIEYCKDLKQI